MHYLALGDSISIDDYTGIAGGGAASLMASALQASPFQNFTGDGWTTRDVAKILPQVEGDPDLITLTVGGNDLLALLMEESDHAPRTAQAWQTEVLLIVRRISAICGVLHRNRNIPIVLNTVYDPTDGNDTYLQAAGLPLAARAALRFLNEGIRQLARIMSCAKLCDLETLFQGHGFWSNEPWLTDIIEPNASGAAMIARRWVELYSESPCAVRAS